MLHGEVKVNGIEVGEWTALHVADRDGFRDYKCYLIYRAEDGYTYEAHWELWGHMRGNGAISLAARVLQEGMTKAKRRRLT